jgi:hypothetical protein
LWLFPEFILEISVYSSRVRRTVNFHCKIKRSGLFLDLLCFQRRTKFPKREDWAGIISLLFIKQRDFIILLLYHQAVWLLHSNWFTLPFFPLITQPQFESKGHMSH